MDEEKSNSLDEWLLKVRQRIEDSRAKQMSPEEMQRQLEALAEVERHTAFINARREQANAEAYMLYKRNPTKYRSAA